MSYLDSLVIAVHRAEAGQVAEVTGSSRAGRLLGRSYVFWKQGACWDHKYEATGYIRYVIQNAVVQST